MASDFTIDLGNGTYLDSSGALKTAPANGKATFKLADALPVPSSQLQLTFKAFETVIPNLNKLGVFDTAKFQGIGMSGDFIAMLGKAANLAEKLASIVPVVNIVAGLANLLGIFGSSSDSDAVTSLVKQQFAKLYQRMDEGDRRAQKDYVDSCMAVFDATYGPVDAYRAELANRDYSPDSEIAAKLQSCNDQLTACRTKLLEAGGHAWVWPFSMDDYKWNWARMAIYRMTSDKGPQFAAAPKEADPFDHRLMVPLLLYGVNCYLSLAKAVSPEYRTTGEFQTQFTQIADRLRDRLADMRNQVLGRSLYHAGDSVSTAPGKMPFTHTFVPIAVGALDLRMDTDVYLESPDALQSAASHGEPERRANLNRAWLPPPSVPFADLQNENYVMTAAAADAANHQAERDYSELLGTRSGFLPLAHLESTLRHLATEPDRSETVTGYAEIWRQPMTGTDVKVTDDKIPFSDPISADARREQQHVEADVFLTTQPLRHSETIGYRIRLLTLPETSAGIPFDWYVWTGYEPVKDPVAEPNDPNRKLVIYENSGLPIDPIDPATGHSAGLLKESDQNSPGPVNSFHLQGTVTLTADTFDWYVPVAPLVITPHRLRAAAMEPYKPGAPGPQPVPPVLAPEPPPAAGNILRASEVLRRGVHSVGSSLAGWEGGEQNWKGEKRDWQRTQVQLTYDLYWWSDSPSKPSQLNIQLKSRPEDRNFTVYVVVEEYLKHSKQWLRTPVQVHVNGQLTYVPQSFFDAEAAARKHAADILGDVERHYFGEPPTGPGRPGHRLATSG
jgi:hypothetical protein